MLGEFPKDYLPNGLKHTAHAAHEKDLLLNDFAAVAFYFCSLCLFVLFFLLLRKKRLDFLFPNRGTRFDGSYFSSAAPLHEVFHHVSDLFHQEGNGPFEKVHALGQVEGMDYIFVLFNVHFVVFNQDYGAFIVVLAAVVWRAKNSNDRRERLVTAPSVHFVAINLDLMSTDNRDEVIGAKNFLHGVKSKLDTAFALWIRTEARLSRVAVVHRV